MPVSKEVQEAVDKVRAMKDYIKADKEADRIRDQQLAEATSKQKEADSKLADLQAKLDALPVNRELSQEDKDALQHAFDEASEAQTNAGDAQTNATEVHDELKDAVPANTDPNAPVNASAPADHVEPTPPPNDPGAPRPDPIPGTGMAGTVPLMPNMAFDPAGGNPPTPGDGQPAQAPAIETSGGFVVAGGGSTQRAPGSRPESPSSSLIVPTDPEAKAPVSTADEVKSGLGDSSQNALKGNDLQPIASGPGIPKEPTPEQAEAAQKQQDALAEEKARREANPLNLSDEDLAKRNAEADAGKNTPADQSNKGLPPVSPVS